MKSLPSVPKININHICGLLLLILGYLLWSRFTKYENLQESTAIGSTGSPEGPVPFAF